MEQDSPDEPPAFNVFGRLGSWHSYRWLSPLMGLFVWLVVPWPQVPPDRMDTLVAINVGAGLAWGIPMWFVGVIATRRGVRCNHGGVVRHYPWRKIDRAVVAWRGVDPRLRLDLVNGREVWAPGFQIPMSQRSSRADGWRTTEMYRAACLITAEARRHPPPSPPDDGLRHPLATVARPQVAGARA